MGSSKDAGTEALLAGLLKSAPQDTVEQVLRIGRSVPETWRRSTVAELVYRLRSRFVLTQRQLAALAGLPSSKIGKIEGGRNVELNTLCQLFAGLGCGLVILPVSGLSAQELWRRTHRLWAEGHVSSRRRYPRR